MVRLPIKKETSASFRLARSERRRIRPRDSGQPGESANVSRPHDGQRHTAHEVRPFCIPTRDCGASLCCSQTAGPRSLAIARGSLITVLAVTGSWSKDRIRQWGVGRPATGHVRLFLRISTAVNLLLFYWRPVLVAGWWPVWLGGWCLPAKCRRVVDQCLGGASNHRPHVIRAVKERPGP